MKNIKTTVFALLSATILSAGLYACSSDDAATAPQTETMQSKAVVNGMGNIKIIPGSFGFGMVSPTIGDCMPGPAFCISSSVEIDPIGGPVFGIGRVDDATIRLVINSETYQQNRQYFPNNVFQTGVDFPLVQEFAKELGFETTTIVLKQATPVLRAEDRDGFYMDLKVVSSKMKFDTTNIKEVYNQGGVQVLVARSLEENAESKVKHGLCLVRKNNVFVDEFILKTDESNPTLKRLDFLETDLSSYLSFEFNLERRESRLIGAELRGDDDDCGQAVIDCMQDAYTNHGWASVAALVSSAFVPDVMVGIGAVCYGKNC